MRAPKLAVVVSLEEFSLTSESNIGAFAAAIPDIMENSGVTRNTGTRIANLLKTEQAQFAQAGIMTIKDFVVQRDLALEVFERFASKEKWTYECFAALLKVLKANLRSPSDKDRKSMFAMRNSVSKVVTQIAPDTSIASFCAMLVANAVRNGKSQAEAKADFAAVEKSLTNLGCNNIKDILNLRMGKIMAESIGWVQYCKEAFFNMVEVVSQEYKTKKRKNVYDA